MIEFLEVYERAVKGPAMLEKDFEMKHFIPVLREVVKEYDINYTPENPVPSDDNAADNLYAAAVEFLSRVGVYCKDTNRVIQFTRKEILDAVQEAPGKCYLGEGKDAGVYTTRMPDEAKTPWLVAGWGWISSTDEMAMNQLETLATLPGVNALKIPAWNSIRGIPLAAGSPVEIYAAIRAVRIGLEAIKRAGRPGMPIVNYIATAASATTTLAASAAQFGCRPTDGWLVGTISEMKVDFEIMNKIAYLLNWGANIGSTTAPILGGYCGGPAGTALVSTAYILVGLLIHKGTYHVSLPTDFRLGCTTTRQVLWVISSSCQAASRNIPLPVNWLGYTNAGVNTRMFFHEAAAHYLCSVPSGAAGSGIPHPARGVKVDGSTPMEAKFGVELAKSAARVKRDQAGDLVNSLLEKYESRIATAPEGDCYQDCYNTVTGKPGEGYMKLYNETIEELAGLGIPL